MKRILATTVLGVLACNAGRAPTTQDSAPTPGATSATASAQPPASAVPPAATLNVPIQTGNGTQNNYFGVAPARRLMGKTIDGAMVQKLQSRPLPGLVLNAYANDAEAGQLANDFWELAVHFKWDVRGHPNAMLTPPEMLRHGVAIESASAAGDGADPLLALKDWLVSVGIQADYSAGANGNRITVWPR